MIALFGGTGRVGSATVEALLSNESAPASTHISRSPPVLRVVTRRPAEANLPPQAELFEGDADNPNMVRSALRGVSRVFLVSAAHPEMYRREASIISAAQEAGVDGFVKLSGSNGLVDSRSPSLAMRHHAASEELLRSSGLRWAILRPSAFMQTLMEQIALFVRDRRRFALPGKDTRYSFIDVRDIAAVAATILTGEQHWNATHVLTGPEQLGYAGIAELLSEALGESVSYRPQSRFMARLAINQQVHYHHARFEAADLLSALAATSGDTPTDTVSRILGSPPRSVAAWIAENLELFR